MFPVSGLRVIYSGIKKIYGEDCVVMWGFPGIRLIESSVNSVPETLSKRKLDLSSSILRLIFRPWSSGIKQEEHKAICKPEIRCLK